MDINRLQFVVHLLAEQVQRERERLMTPKLGIALEAMRKLQSFAEDEGEKLTKRITDEAMPILTETFKGAHAAIDTLHTGMDDIKNFCDDIKKVGGNGAPLGDQSQQQGQQLQPPRSSEVASS